MLKKVIRLSLFVMITLTMSLAACSQSEKTGGKSEPLDDYPSKPITVLVGFSPGGGSDVNARTLTKAMTDNNIVDQSFQIKNLPGGGGANAYTQMINDPDNIYQIMEVPEIAYPIVNGSMKADYSDFQFVGQSATQTMAIIVKKDSKIQSVEDLVKVLREDPSSLSIAISGALDGGEAHRWYTIYKEVHGDKEVSVNDLSFVPQEGDSVTSVVGGHTDIALENPALALDFVETDEVKVLAVLSKERLDIFPEAPTLVEKDLEIIHSRARSWWMGKDVPQEIVKYWQDRMKEATETEDWQNYVEKNAFESTFLEAEEYGKFLSESGKDFKEYIKLIKR